MKSLKLSTIALTFAFSTLGMTHSAMVFAGEGHDHDEKPTSVQKQPQHDDEENVVVLNEQAILANGIKTERASNGTISQHDTLFGVVAPTIDNTFTIMAPYQGIVEKVFVEIGDRVTKNQPLLKVQNRQTLQSYIIKSPADGEVTERLIAQGQLALDQTLLTIINLKQVWVELSAFPENIEKLQIGQSAAIYDLHQHLNTSGKVSYIAPMMTGGHIARARVVINNRDGHWRPGMHVKADVKTAELTSQLRVKQTAIQSLEDENVVFVKTANRFEARHVTLGEANREWVSVIEGLNAGEEYVTENSYILKADILKNGASHAH
ncbi:efflux RND transporter periplasmic adaptor subunit [Pseudoalteromonas sp. SS15]|uniref:efflux RND transporter periplasmic adaptor subunit n=1 Tax=Pseudoalteromonas sp. SS15 TaxID=3139393 RepID=UPI003BADA4B4